MPDYGSAVADKAIDATTRKVHRIYQQAAKELKAKLKEFNAQHKAKQKEMLAQLKNGNGKWSDDELKAGDFNGNGKLDNADYQALRALLKDKGAL